MFYSSLFIYDKFDNDGNPWKSWRDTFDVKF